jgi:hypothetical protein
MINKNPSSNVSLWPSTIFRTLNQRGSARELLRSLSGFPKLHANPRLQIVAPLLVSATTQPTIGNSSDSRKPQFPFFLLVSFSLVMTYEADMADTFLFLVWDQNVLTIWQAWFSASPIIC